MCRGHPVRALAESLRGKLRECVECPLCYLPVFLQYNHQFYSTRQYSATLEKPASSGISLRDDDSIFSRESSCLCFHVRSSSILLQWVNIMETIRPKEELLSSDEELPENRKDCLCIICKHLGKKLATDKRLELINTGKPRPDLVLKYDAYDWLTACVKNNRFYCWPCLLFSSSRDPKGFRNNEEFLQKNLAEHVSSASHLGALIDMKIFQTNAKSLTVMDTAYIDMETLEKNRNILKLLIDITIFFNSQDIWPERRRDIYPDLIKLFPGNFKATFKVIQTIYESIYLDLEKTLATHIRNCIINEIKQTQFIALILIETSNKLAIVLRYVNRAGRPQEKFITFLNNSSKKLLETIFNIIEMYECGNKLMAQSFYGGPVYLEKAINKRYRYANIIPCSGHNLNLMLVDSVSTIPEAKSFFKIIHGMVKVFSQEDLKATLEALFPPIEHWNNPVDLIANLYKYRLKILELFKICLQRGEDFDSKTVCALVAYQHLLEGDLKFIFFLVAFADIFSHICDLTDKLKSANEDCVTMFTVKKMLLSKQNGVFIWTKIRSRWSEYKTSFPKEHITTNMMLAYTRIIQTVINELSIRFQNYKALKFMELQDIIKQSNRAALQSLEKNYSKLFNTVNLSKQVALIRGIEETLNYNAVDLLRFIRKMDIDKEFVELVKLFELIVTMPVLINTKELSEATVARISEFAGKMDKKKCAISEDFIVSWIEREFVEELKLSGEGFYERIFKEFSQINKSLKVMH